MKYNELCQGGMGMGKVSSKVKNRYNKKAYDQILLFVPKGQKATIQQAAQEAGESVNMYIQKALLAFMGIQEWPELKQEESE